MYFASFTKTMRDPCNIENEVGILIQGKRNYCSKLKKEKLKTKKLLKTILDE